MKNAKMFLACLACLGFLCSCSPKPKHLVLWEAIEAGDARGVNAVIAQGVDVNAKNKDENGGTALMMAAREGNVDIVKALLAAGADIGAKDNDGDAALVWAVEEGRADIVEMLLAAGADINAQNEDGETALVLAIGAGDVDVVKLLLDAGADIHVKDKDGDTARDVVVQWQKTYQDILELIDRHPF